MENILYALSGKEDKTNTFGNDRFRISVLTINPKTFIGFCGQRYTTVYIDAALATKANQLLINQIKACCCIGKGDIHII